MVAMQHICSPLLSIAQQRGDAPVLVGEGLAVGGRALYRSVCGLSTELALRFRPGDVIALIARNTPEFIRALLGIAGAGAVAALMNWRWSGSELAAACRLCNVAAIVVDDICLETYRQVLCNEFSDVPLLLLPSSGGGRHHSGGGAPVLPPQCSRIVLQEVVARSSASSTWTPCGDDGDCFTWRHPPSGAAVACFTSGSTGRHKAAALGHAALTLQSLAKLATVGYSADDVYLHTAPLFHVGGLSSCLAALTAGATHVFLPRGGEYSAARALEAIAAHRVTAFIAVPAMLKDMTEEAAGRRRQQPPQGGRHEPLACVARVLIGAGSPSPALLADCCSLFPSADWSLSYGMTEACSSIAVIRLGRGRAAVEAVAAGSGPAGTCVGWPVPGTEVRIRREADSASDSIADSPPPSPSSFSSSSVGEVLVRGPHLMLGYLAAAAAATAAATGVPPAGGAGLLPGGWLATGDLGYMDGRGRLVLAGRVKDVIKSGGENVVGGAVEAALEAHAGVAAAAVVGLPHERLGEQVSRRWPGRDGGETAKWRARAWPCKAMSTENRDRPQALAAPMC